ncbi:hypothetical protein [Nocardia sp. NPDC051832]
MDFTAIRESSLAGTAELIRRAKNTGHLSLRHPPHDHGRRR